MEGEGGLWRGRGKVADPGHKKAYAYHSRVSYGDIVNPSESDQTFYQS